MGGLAAFRVVRFGPFQADLREGELRKQGRKLKIQEQPFQVLAALLERPGEIVTREELRQRIWPDEFVEFEHSLNVAVSKLREALGDSAERPRYIETVPRHGYRFIAPVAPVELRRWPRWLAAAAIVLAVAAGVGGIFFRPQQREPRAVPFTSLLGFESYAAISPDGKMVAFSKEGDIYVQQVGGQNPDRRTDGPAWDFSPVWSPDTLEIAFCRLSAGGFTIRVMEALSGPERTLGQSKASWAWLAFQFPRLAWSPNGELLAVMDRQSPTEPLSIFSLSIQTHEKQRLTSPTPQSVGDIAPAFSPDGRTLAFIRAHTAFSGDIYLLTLGSDGTLRGEPRPLTSDGSHITGLDWTADSRSIVFSGWHRGVRDLWRIPVSGGEPQRLNLGERLSYPSIARRSDRLVGVKIERQANIWRTAGPNSSRLTSTGKGSPPERVIASTGWDSFPSYSRDGGKIAFTSFRDTPGRIWKCDSDGSNQVLLTNVPGWYPRWSPDGQRIAFGSPVEVNADIYVVSAEGGASRRLTLDASRDERASWSKDGKWIYFGSNRSGDWQIWRMPSEGRAAEQVTKNGGFEGFESADGRFLYYTKWSPVGIWKIPVTGGEEIQVLNKGVESRWELLKDGICYVDERTEEGVEPVRFYRFSSRQTEHVTEFPKGTVLNAFAVSPDGRWILYAVVERDESDIMLVENFR